MVAIGHPQGRPLPLKYNFWYNGNSFFCRGLVFAALPVLNV